MSENALNLGIPTEQANRLIGWVEKGMEHPCVSQYKHGEFLNDLGDGRFTADFFGFALVGKFGEPAAALEQLNSVGNDPVKFAELLEVDPNKIEGITFQIGNMQDYLDIGTKAVVARIRNHYSPGVTPATQA